jgi:anti-anti-sigma regulatory factor
MTLSLELAKLVKRIAVLKPSGRLDAESFQEVRNIVLIKSYTLSL